MKLRKRKVLRIALGLVLCFNGYRVAGGAQPDRAQLDVGGARNTALVRRWIDEGFNKRNIEVVDEIFAEKVTINAQQLNRDDLKRNMRRRLNAFPDLHVTIDEVVAEGKMVGIWYTAKGTHRGEFEGIAATGRQVTWSGVDLLRIQDGKIAEGRFVDDSLGLMQQLGAKITLAPAQRPN